MNINKNILYLRLIQKATILDYVRKIFQLSSCNVFVSGAGGLRLKSRAGQIGRSVADC